MIKLQMYYCHKFQDSSFVARTKLIPDIKKTIPSIPKIINDLISRVSPDVPANITAVQIKPTIPRIVSNPPKNLFKFMILVLKVDNKCIMLLI